MTNNEQVYFKDLARAERKNIPVNLVYPADYPNRPAILLEELISPNHAIQALERIGGKASRRQSLVASKDSKTGN